MSEALENLQPGDKVGFKAYAELPPGDEPLFTEVGQELEVIEVRDDGAYIVKAQDGTTDTLFVDEIQPLEDAPAGEDEEAPLDWKDVKKDAQVDVVSIETSEVVVQGTVEAKTAKSVTVAGEKFPKAKFDLFPMSKPIENTEAEAAEPEEEQLTEVPFAKIEKGDVILVVDKEDNDVVEGGVTAKTKSSLTINKVTYSSKDFVFFFAGAPAEYEEGQDQEPEVKAEGEAGTPDPDPKPEEAKTTSKAKATETPKVVAPEDVPRTKNLAAASTPTEHDTQSVRSILADRDALVAAKETVETIEESSFTLGGLLAHIYHEELYTTAGYDGNKAFETYLKEELGIEYRKAMYLIKIYTHFSALGVDEARLAEIGWSKAKELVKVATAENFDELVDYAANHTRAELEEYIRTDYIDAGDGSDTKTEPKAKRVTFKFWAFEDAANVWLDAIEKVKDEHGLTDDNEAFGAIITEWAQLVEGMDVPLEDVLKTVGHRYGVKLAVVDEEDKEAEPETKPARRRAAAK